ncbi:MAG: NAD(P)H-hydrate epimerase [Eggerthellaceae bacterium]
MIPSPITSHDHTIVSEVGSIDAPVLDVAEVVALEQRIAAAGTSLYELMHRAGCFLGREVQQILQERTIAPSDSHVAVLCGYGNNGGDGWVAADYLRKAGYLIDVITPRSAHELTAEPAHTTACDLEETLMDDPSVSLLVDPDQKEVDECLQRADVIIDALLGTGFTGDAVREPFASWIKSANHKKRSTACVVAADVPSGFNAQTGDVANPCVKADRTVTMICLKTGLCAPGSHEYCGSITVAPLADVKPFL